ncbi:hypothetical protein VTI28DRAFT_8260 [Corynascus sepedonium]
MFRTVQQVLHRLAMGNTATARFQPDPRRRNDWLAAFSWPLPRPRILARFVLLLRRQRSAAASSARSRRWGASDGGKRGAGLCPVRRKT